MKKPSGRRRQTLERSVKPQPATRPVPNNGTLHRSTQDLLSRHAKKKYLQRNVTFALISYIHPLSSRWRFILTSRAVDKHSLPKDKYEHVDNKMMWRECRTEGAKTNSDISYVLALAFYYRPTCLLTLLIIICLALLR